MGRSNFEGGKGRPIVKYRDTLQSSVQRRLNGSSTDAMLWARMGCRNYVLDESPEVLRVVAMATHIGTQFAITGFLAFDWL